MSGRSYGAITSSAASRSSGWPRDGPVAQHDPGGGCAATRHRPISEQSPASKLDPFKPEIHWLLGGPKLPGIRVRELLEPLSCSDSKTVVDDYLREVRPQLPATADLLAHRRSEKRERGLALPKFAETCRRNPFWSATWCRRRGSHAVCCQGFI